jgi:hypothetical protein
MSERLSWLALLAVLAVHFAMVAYFFGEQLPLPELAFNRGDFATHANQVNKVIAGYQTAGQHWVYDVQLLAGAPNGEMFDADVKGWELWTWMLVELGYAQGWAYNSYILLIHLLLPVVVYASARLFRLDGWAATVATAFAVLLWSFDSFTHWMWMIGTVTYCAVAYGALLPLALFHRWIEPRWEGPGLWAGARHKNQDRRWPFALGCALAMAFGHLTHPYLFFILVAPLLALYFRAWLAERSLTAMQHAITIGIAVFTVAANWWWLKTALRFSRYLLDSAFYEQGGIEFVWFDLLGILHDASSQGMIGPRVLIRLFALIAAIASLRAWRASADRRRLPFLVLIVSMAALTFLGGYTPFAQIQPYRHNLPLGFALVIPAGWWLTEAMRGRPWRSLAPTQRVLGFALGSLAALGVLAEVRYFFASTITQAQLLDDGRTVPMNSLGHNFTPRYTYDEQEDVEPVLAWITAHDDGQGRWLIQDQTFGEYTMARTKAQVIGGFLVRNIEHSDANWWRHAGRPPYSAEKLAEYLQTYAVRWVVLQKYDLDPWWDKHPKLLTRAGFVDGWIFYQVNVDTSLLSGRGRVEAELNRIEVSRTDPNEDVLLRFHWMETMRCRPDCEIERAPVEGDRVGFMRVPAPHPRDFVIENSYEWPE